MLAERFFGFDVGARQWIGIGLVAASLALLTLTGGGAHSGYSLVRMILFEGIAIGFGLLLMCSHLIEPVRARPGVLLGIAAGLGFGISDVAIKALSGDLQSGPIGLLSPGAASSSQRPSSRSSPPLAASRSATAWRSSPSPRSRPTSRRSSRGWRSSATDSATALSS